MYEPSQIGVPPTEAKTLSNIGNEGDYTLFLNKSQAIFNFTLTYVLFRVRLKKKEVFP